MEGEILKFMTTKRRYPYTFITFTACFPAHAVDIHPQNPEMWRTLCGMEHNRRTGAVVPGARRCRDCRMEVQRRGKCLLNLKRTT